MSSQRKQRVRRKHRRRDIDDGSLQFDLVTYLRINGLVFDGRLGEGN